MQNIYADSNQIGPADFDEGTTNGIIDAAVHQNYSIVRDLFDNRSVIEYGCMCLS